MFKNKYDLDHNITISNFLFYSKAGMRHLFQFTEGHSSRDCCLLFVRLRVAIDCNYPCIVENSLRIADM